MTAYRRDFDESQYMLFLIKDDKLLQKYNRIWDKVSNSMRKSTKRRSQCICLSVILFESVFRNDKNYYS